MNGKEFVNKVFEEVWEYGAKPKHYIKNIFVPKRYTYEETLDMIKQWKLDNKRSPRISTMTNVNTNGDIVDKLLNQTNYENGWKGIDDKMDYNKAQDELDYEDC